MEYDVGLRGFSTVVRPISYPMEYLSDSMPYAVPHGTFHGVYHGVFHIYTVYPMVQPGPMMFPMVYSTGRKPHRETRDTYHVESHDTPPL